MGKHRYLKIRMDTLAEAAFILYFSFSAFTTIFTKIFAFLGIGGTRVGLVLLVVLVLTALPFGLRYGLRDCLILYICILFVFAISIPINPNVLEWYRDPNWGLVYRVFRPDRAIYAYLIVRLVSKKELLERDLKIVGYINFIYILHLGLGRITLGYWEILANDGITMVKSSYNMAYGYNAAFVALIMFVFLHKNNKAVHLALGIISAILSIIFGSRGVLLVFAAYVVILFCLKLKEEYSTKKLITLILAIIAFAVIYINYTSIITGVAFLAQRLGIESRNIMKLLSVSDFTTGSGRDEIAKLSIEGIKKSFPFGNGAYGDRTSVGTIFAWGYSHNIALEMLASFGVFGIIILLWIIIVSLKIIFGESDKSWRNLFILFFCNSLKLLVSDSFWYLSFFWAMLAIISCIRREKKRIYTGK